MSKGKGLMLLQIRQVQRIKKNLQYYISKNNVNKRWDSDSDSYMPLSPTLSKKSGNKKSITNSPREEEKKKGRKSKTPQFTDNLSRRSKSKEAIQKKISQKGHMPKGFGVTQGGKIIRKDLSDQQQSILFSQILSKNKNGQLEQVLNTMSKNKIKKVKTPRNQIQNISKEEYFQMKVIVSDENKLEKQKTVYTKPYTFSSITDLLDKKMKQKEEKDQKDQKQEKQIQKKDSNQKSSFFSILMKFGGNVKKVQQKKEQIKYKKDQSKIQSQKLKKLDEQKQKQKTNIPELKPIVNKSPEEEKKNNEKFSTLDKSIKQQNNYFTSLKTQENEINYYESEMTDRQKSRKSMKVYPAISFTERQENQLRSKYWNLNSKLDQLKNRIRKQCYDKQKDRYEKSMKEKTERSREIEAAGLYKKLSPIKKIRTQLARRNLEQQREKYQRSLTKQLKLEQILRTQDESQSLSRKKRSPGLYYSHRSKRSKEKQKLLVKKK